MKPMRLIGRLGTMNVVVNGIENDLNDFADVSLSTNFVLKPCCYWIFNFYLEHPK